MTNEITNINAVSIDGITEQAISACPHLATALTKTKNSGQEQVQLVTKLAKSPGLLRASEVEQGYSADSPMARTLNWVKSYLAKPHPELGRKGPVCPFVPNSLELDHIWMAEVQEESFSIERVGEIISDYRELFLTTEPISEPESMNKAFMIVFPTLGEQGAAFVDQVQYKLKKEFVDLGLMLGEFHANNQSPGLRNPNFKPLRSPIPMLAIRHMVDTDLPFLLKEDYPAEERAAFLRSYLTCLGGSLSSAKFDNALNGVIEAEIEKSRASSHQNGKQKGTQELCTKCGLAERVLEPSL